MKIKGDKVYFYLKLSLKDKINYGASLRFGAIANSKSAPMTAFDINWD